MEATIDTSTDYITGDEFDVFDPASLYGIEDATDEGENLLGYGSIPEAPKQKEQQKPDNRTPQEKIEGLLESMPKARGLLLSIIELCKDRQPVDDVNGFVDKLKDTNFTIYSAASLCQLLEEAGGLVHVDEYGNSFSEVSKEPECVEEDGAQYLVVPEQAASFWESTEEGIAVLTKEGGGYRIEQLFEEDDFYLPVYREIFTMCHESPKSISEIDDALRDHPLLQEPLLHGSHFVDKLELNGALEWDHGWCLSEVGLRAFSRIEKYCETDPEQ